MAPQGLRSARRRASACIHIPHQAEAQAPSLVFGGVGVAQGAAAAIAVEVPAAAADHPLESPLTAASVPDPLRAGAARSPRVACRPRRIGGIPVLGPFPKVAVHVVKPPRVRWVAADWRRPAQVAP